MHRDPSFSFGETIARLEAEVQQLRALGGKRRERRLVIATVVSMTIAIHSMIGCVATRVHADRLVRDASTRLNRRTSDFIACVHTLEARNKEADLLRLRADAQSSADDP
jgi:hypothetical protein